MDGKIYEITTLFFDNFTNSLNPDDWSFNRWEEGGSYLGRTQQRQSLPTTSNGYLHLELDTYNPTSKLDNPSFYGSEAITNILFSNDTGGISFEIKAHLGSSVGGIVGGIFAYNFRSSAFHDEIDFEALSNDISKVQTNVYENEPLGPGHANFCPITGLSTEDHVYRIEWLPDCVRWFVDNLLVRESWEYVPQEFMALHLNIWAPSQEWAEAFNDTITPVTDSSENTTYLFDIDSVHVAKLSTNYGTNSSDVLIGTSYNDWISGIDGDDTVCGGNGDDVIFGGFGDDNIDGGEGEDTITLTGLPSQYFLFENSMSGLEGVDALLNVEHFRFGSSLENILCICNLTAEDLTDPDGGGPEVSPAEDLLQGISDLYVAFFNRAPDVGGLMYWFKEVMNGTWSVATIAQSFTDQVEYKATYPDGLSNREFIETIYQNLFDREPDTAGWDYWENDLNHGTPRNVFIYTVIQGAYAPTGGASDRALLNNKHDVSLYYSEQLATHSSESFDNNIDEVLDRVTSNSQTVEDAEAVIDYVMDHEITLTGVVQDVELWESFWG